MTRQEARAYALAAALDAGLDEDTADAAAGAALSAFDDFGPFNGPDVEVFTETVALIIQAHAQP